MSAQDILKMIEEVDPSDTAKLDEIDARVFLYTEFPELTFHSFNGYHPLYLNEKKEGPFEFGGSGFKAPQYTRSRDALKAMRKDFDFINIEIVKHDWRITDDIFNTSFRISIDKNGGVFHFCSQDCTTEELAELHAIIQVIEFERTK